MLTVMTTGIADYLDEGSGRIKCLILGPSGAGNTRSAGAGWPKPLLADCEEGRMSVADQHIPYAAIKTTADMKALLDLAEAECKRPKDQQRFQTLIIDTLDAYQRIVITEYLSGVKKAQMSGWQDWGHLDAEMTTLVARLNKISMNVVVNLHVKDTKVGGGDDGEGGILVHGPKLKGDLKDQIASEFDLVGFMETGWVAVNGKRELARYIQWEPTPDKPILKDRSGQLPARTPVDFTSEDYEGLLRPLQEAQAKLSAGTVVVEVETEAPVTHEPVAKGGPVTTSVPNVGTAKKAAAPAKKAAAKAPPPVPAVTTPVPAAEVPVVEPVAVPVTEAEAVSTVEQVLGGKVVEPDSPANPVGQSPDLPTHVGEPELAAEIDSSAPELPAAPAEVAGNGTITVACGDARYSGGTALADLNSCGRKLVLDMQEERVTGCSEPEGQNPELIQIAGLKTRAFLCNTCFAAHRNASKK